MSMPQPSFSATPAPRKGVPADSSYDVGGPIADMHDVLAQRMAIQAAHAPAALPIHWSENLVRGFSRASGPVLLVAGFALVARAFF